jgi:hypothetical protein
LDSISSVLIKDNLWKKILLQLYTS